MPVNKKKLFQLIDRLIAVFALSWLLLVGGGGAQLTADQSQEPAAHTVQSEEAPIEVADYYTRWGNFWSG